MIETKQELRLNPNEKDVTKTFKTLLNMDGKKAWSSDDFRRYGLDRFLRGNPRHSIGGLFAKWVHNKLIREVGTTRSMIRSNHLRRISLYEFTE